MPVIDFRAIIKPAKGSTARLQLAPLVVGAGLFLLLFFTTFTVFVKSDWALQCFQIGIYGLVAGYLLWSLRSAKDFLSTHPAAWLVYLIPVWGIVQIVAHTTSSSFETRREVLRWGALAGVFFLTQIATGTTLARRMFLTVMLSFATLMAVLCLLQLMTSGGEVLWIFPTGFPDVYATFPNHNNYAQFAELALPIALWRALSEGWRSWWYAAAGGAIYASVIGAASRAGAILTTAEIVTMLLIWLAIERKKHRRPRQEAGQQKVPDVAHKIKRKKKSTKEVRSTIAVLALIPALALIFTFAVGWQHALQRFHTNDQFGARWEFLVAATRMAESKPITGYGLGTFPEVYQRFAIKDFPFYANHAHNDWAEFAADGGIPFMLLVLIPFAAAIPVAVRYPWGIGLVFVMIHAGADYPFPRPAVSGWMFALLALLYMRRESDKAKARNGINTEPEGTSAGLSTAENSAV